MKIQSQKRFCYKSVSLKMTVSLLKFHFFCLILILLYFSFQEYDYSYYQYSLSFEHRKPCFYMGEIFFHGSTWKPLPCAQCKCVDGDSHCQFHTCPEIECQGTLKRRARKCCPTCHGKVICKYKSSIFHLVRGVLRSFC